MAVQPFSLPRVQQAHLQGIFGDFEEVVKARIDTLRATEFSQNVEKARFFEYLLSAVDPEKYLRLQQRFLGDGVLNRNSDLAKFINPIIWFESKLTIARQLKLHTRAPMRILDLGTGPGHFAVVARFYGHEITGTDLPHCSQGTGEKGHLYDALCDIFQVTRISHVIKPNEPLHGLRGPYDMVTAFLAAFNLDENKNPWSIEQWRFFMASLKRDVLKEDGMLCMTLAAEKLTDTVWDYLSSKADYADSHKMVLFSNFSAFV